MDYWLHDKIQNSLKTDSLKIMKDSNGSNMEKRSNIDIYIQWQLTNLVAILTQRPETITHIYKNSSDD